MGHFNMVEQINEKMNQFPNKLRGGAQYRERRLKLSPRGFPNLMLLLLAIAVLRLRHFINDGVLPVANYTSYQQSDKTIPETSFAQNIRPIENNVSNRQSVANAISTNSTRNEQTSNEQSDKTILEKNISNRQSIANDVSVNSTRNEQTRTKFLLPPSQWLTDIDMSSKLTCGLRKCAFNSRASQRDDNLIRYGYLVSQEWEGEYGERHFESLTNATEIARNLSEKFHIRHTLLGYPYMTESNITKELADELSQDQPRWRKNYTDTKTIIIQPIELYSESTMLLKCRDLSFKRKFKKRTLPKLSEVELQIFEEQLRSDLNQTLEMINSNEAPCLLNDFQVAIDPITGRIYHIDFDRCFDKQKHVGKCGEDLRKYTEHMIAQRRSGNLTVLL